MKANCKDGVYLLGRASSEVTGSMYLIKFNDLNVLLECGLYASPKNSYLDAYKVNTAKFDFDPEEIDVVILCHAHIDHSGLLARLYAEGCKAPCVMRKGTYEILKYLLANSAYVVQTEANRMGKAKGRVYKPVYTIDDVELVLSHAKIIDELDVLFELANKNGSTLTFQWLRNSHCVGAGSPQLIFKDKIRTKKVMYTSDIGSFKPDNAFVTDTEIPTFFNDITLMESTYGDPCRKKGHKRQFDLNKLDSITNTIIMTHAQAIFAAFSFAKSQQIIFDFYSLYGDDEDFTLPIYVDSMLTCDISQKAYPNALSEEDKGMWKKVLKWKNLHFLRDKDDSIACLQTDTTKIVISSSGFCVNGRVVEHIKKNIKNPNSIIVITGYPGGNETYLSYRLLNDKNAKKIKIEGKEYPFRANVLELSSYSSHANFNELIEYGSSVRTNMVVLIHGDMEAKLKMKPYLEDAISKKNKTHKVVIGKQGMFIPF